MSPVLTLARKAPAKWTDTRLVKECLAGNEEAWSALIDKYKALIYSIPVKYQMPPQEAADVFQAVCMELLSRLPGLREPKALPAWLIQVTHHQCFRWKRQQQRVVRSDSETGILEPEIPPIAESLIRQTQEEQILREAISELAPQCQKLVAALFFESPARPYADIAAELGLAVGSIGFTRQKCIERLRKSLKKMGFE
jgi:RNA polymerase sigma factor (sigma-70 family)|nr:sigma-70 family RNA polymerase sigma factor [Candidatus Acidoferrales bacterium]